MPEHGDERCRFVEAQPRGERIEGLDGAAAGADLGRHDLKMAPELAAALRHLAGHAIERGLEAEPGIDADNEEIEQVGEYLTVALSQRALPPHEIEIRRARPDKDRDCDEHEPDEAGERGGEQAGEHVDEERSAECAGETRQKVVVDRLPVEIARIEQLAPQLLPRRILDAEASLPEVPGDEPIDAMQRLLHRHVGRRLRRQAPLHPRLQRQMVTEHEHDGRNRRERQRRNNDGRKLDHGHQNLKLTMRYMTTLPTRSESPP